MNRIGLRRVYGEPGTDEGRRILVDRIWPRGISKEEAQIDEWMRQVGPSTELRHWFGHDPARWDEFVRRYRAEIAKNPTAFDHLLAEARQGPITLVYGAKDTEHNQAVALKEFLEERLRQA
jgi:uncharacterized protein YeaO (DUF488 family)